MVVLTLPLAAGARWLSLLAFLGGLSAATAMVVVESVALSTMVCNDLVMPVLLRLLGRGRERRPDRGCCWRSAGSPSSAWCCWASVYMQAVGDTYALVSIGLVSFAAVAQFAPAHRARPVLARRDPARRHRSAIRGGFLVWVWTLLLPSLALSGILGRGFLDAGLFGLGWTRPHALFGLTSLDPITHSLFWSMLANVGLLVGASVLVARRRVERAQARDFVDVVRGARGRGRRLARARRRSPTSPPCSAASWARPRAGAARRARARAAAPTRARRRPTPPSCAMSSACSPA